jgi:cytochrome c oxidase cbb3-type subunit 1
MIAQLTVRDRRLALLLLATGMIVGLAMAIAGAGEAFGAHGLIVVLFSSGLFGLVLRHFDDPDPRPARLASYYDDPIKVGIVLAMIWGAVGMSIGLWVAALLVWPDLTFDAAWSSFGRLRPAHTTAVIFGFGGTALIATSFHVMQRTARARLAGEFSPWFVLMGFQLFVILAVSGYLMGITQSKEYAEAEWYADLWLVVVWVTYFVLYLRTLARRTEPHIYVANWYYMAFILIVAVLHIFNNIAVPVSWGGSRSYILWAGVQDAMMQWWYGHNAVAFFLTAGFLGMLYYYLPKRAERPIYSYRLSILSFWGIVFFYVWAGSHHLHYTALPHWAQTLGMTFSVMLLVPSWATAANALLTLNGAWERIRDDATMRFMMVAAIFYGLTTFEGSFLAIRGVNALSHYTDWTVGHVHAGALGWNAILIFGAVYAAVPVIWRREAMWSDRLVEVHFWLAVMGTATYVFAMWNAGITQGLMWRTYNDAGALQYSFIDSIVAMIPYYVARFVGGSMFLLGTLIGIFNIWMTIRAAPDARLARDRPAAGDRGVPAE